MQLHIKIELVQVFQRCFLGLGQRLLDHLAGGIRVQSPVLAEVLGNLPFFAGAERSKRPPQKHQGPAELLLVQRFDVPRELLPQRLPRQEGVPVTLRKTFKPVGPKVSRYAGRNTP